MRAAWGQTGNILLPDVPVSFVNPPPSPLTASAYLFASAGVPLDQVRRAGFSVRNASQAWEYTADYVTDLSLYMFYWDISSFPSDAYVVSFWVETQDDRHGRAEVFLAVAGSTPTSSGGTSSVGGGATDTSGSTSGTATDSAGTGEGSVTPPELRVTAPTDGAHLEGSVRLEASSSVPFASVGFFLDNLATAASPDATFPGAAADNGLRWEYQLNASALPAGSYVVGVGGSYQGTMVRGIATVAVTVGATSDTAQIPPPFTISYRNPPASPIDSAKYLFIQSSIPFSQIRQVTFRVSGSGQARTFDGAPVAELGLHQFYWQIGDFPDGSYLVAAEAESIDSRKATAELYLTVSRPSPLPLPGSELPAAVQFSFLSPSGDSISGTVTVVVVTTPAVPALVVHYGGPQSGTLQPTLTDGRWQAAWDAGQLPDGTYDLVAATMINGTTFESPPHRVIVAKTASGTTQASPLLIIEQPLADAVLTGIVELRGLVSGTTVERLRLRLDHPDHPYEIGYADLGGDGRWALPFDTRQARNGGYQLRAFALTAEGSGLQAAVSVDIANASSVTDSAAPPLVENRPPHVSAGSDRAVNRVRLILEGSVTDDGLPQPPGKLSLRWTQASGSGVVVFVHPELATSEVVFPRAGTYRLRLTVYDGEREASDEVTITVSEDLGTPAAPPNPLTAPARPPAGEVPPQLPAMPDAAEPAHPQPSRQEAVDSWCLGQGITTAEACEQALAEARKDLPEDCVANRILHPEACRRFLFGREHDAPAEARLAPECESQHLDRTACDALLRRKFLPAECVVADLNDPGACQRYLAARALPAACLQAGVTDPKGCEVLLLEQYVSPACLAAGLTDPNACVEHLKTRLANTVTCRGDAADCPAAIARHLPTLMHDQRQLERLEAAVAPNINVPLVLTTEHQAAPRDDLLKVEQVVPVVVAAPISVRLLRSVPDVIITREDEVQVGAPALLVFDTDGDGLPDDVEQRLGTDPQAADSDRDGYPDGQELRTGHNPLGLGAPTMAIAPVEQAIAAGKPLQQPFVLPAAVVTLRVDAVTNLAPSDGIAQGVGPLQLSGRGQPGEVVTIFIYSSLPLVVTTRVNADGNWSYTLRQSLIDGAHEAYVTVNDETGKAVARSAPLGFFVREARAATPAEVFAFRPPARPGFSRARLYLPIAGLVISLGAFLFLAVWNAHRKRTA